MEFLSGQWLLSVLQIVWIDILLSGDNAVVIALACRSLPAHQKRLGIFLGATVAVALRIVFALVISILLGVPYLRIAGGFGLAWSLGFLSITIDVEALLQMLDTPATGRMLSQMQTVAMAAVLLTTALVLWWWAETASD